MKHYCVQEWQDYIDRRLPESLCEKLEEHLDSCENCLELYILAMDAKDGGTGVYTLDEHMETKLPQKTGFRRIYPNTVITLTLPQDIPVELRGINNEPIN